MDKENFRMAVLIDADNISYADIGCILNEIAKEGEASVKRLYGDFASSYIKNWQDKINEYGIIPVQQFAYTQGKNATDTALIIDAMDLLYTQKLNAYCIVSSDSDYTRLALRLKESGLQVYGYGEKKTPPAFRNACNKFIYIENLRPKTESDSLRKSSQYSTEELPESCLSKEDAVELIKNTIATACNDDGTLLLSKLGALLLRQRADFDARNYGYITLGGLLRDYDSVFEIIGSFGTTSVKLK